MIAFLKVMHFSSLLFRTLIFSLFWSFTAFVNYTLKTGCFCIIIRPSYPTKKETEEMTSINLDSCFEDTMLVYVILIIKTVCRISYAFLSIKFWGFMKLQRYLLILELFINIVKILWFMRVKTCKCDFVNIFFKFCSIIKLTSIFSKLTI